MKKPHITTLGAPSHGSESHDEYRTDIEFTTDSATEAGSAYSSAGGSDSTRQGTSKAGHHGVIHPVTCAIVAMAVILLFGFYVWPDGRSKEWIYAK